MKNTILLFTFSVITCFNINAQQEEMKTDSLQEVIITSSRIDLPFKENSKTISIITAADIKQSAATNVADLLQQVAGVDIRRRGTGGSQADLYIRGGGFDQTLLLIDGIKVEDAQTGHHTLNMALPLEVIERIEIVKGPAARIFGQNAFTGAINIVTKKHIEDLVAVKAEAGSFGQKNASITVGSNLENSSHIIHVERNTSDGYRYNTDYDNQSYFVKSTFNTKNAPINVIANFQERKFGANGFYASPSAIDQYEETQTSLIGVSTEYKIENLTIKPRVYWRRNQDIYVFVRQDPSIYRNVHIGNKVGAEVNASYKSKFGTTGFGVDIAKVALSSNNLGSRNRFMTNAFLEHQFKFLNDKIDVTPGVALNYFSDFKFHAFPGVDIGYQAAENLRLYGNIGYTYRVPTYTDLFYSDPTTLGNENLEPEEAIAEEFGIKYNTKNLTVSAAVFNRDSKKLIDFVKENEADLWEAVNIVDLNTKGFEANAKYAFTAANHKQSINLGYTFIEDEIKDLNVNFSRYSINSLKHQATASFRSQFFKNISQTIVYKYAQRTSGQSYNVYDASIALTLKAFEVSVIANNIFNAEYSETNLVPNPKGNVLFGLSYVFK
ncbi:TonB-dependent receptor plug domain-containing protein [Lacinutrix undariae]